MQSDVLLIDGTGLVHRAYWSVATSEPGASGLPLFRDWLRTAIKNYNPKKALVALDSKKTFRHVLLDTYKAGRVMPPNQLIEDLRAAEASIERCGLAHSRILEHEADDIIASLAVQTQPADVVIISSDRDMLQLVTDRVIVINPIKGLEEVREWTIDAIYNKYGVYPDQWVGFRALTGDQADNLPGAPGIGMVKASRLMHEYGNIRGVIQAAQRGGLPEKMARSILDNYDRIMLNLGMMSLIDTLEVKEWDHATVEILNANDAFLTENSTAVHAEDDGQSLLDAVISPATQMKQPAQENARDAKTAKNTKRVTPFARMMS